MSNYVNTSYSYSRLPDNRIKLDLTLNSHIDVEDKVLTEVELREFERVMELLERLSNE